MEKRCIILSIPLPILVSPVELAYIAKSVSAGGEEDGGGGPNMEFLGISEACLGKGSKKIVEISTKGLTQPPTPP